MGYECQSVDMTRKVHGDRGRPGFVAAFVYRDGLTPTGFLRVVAICAVAALLAVIAPLAAEAHDELPAHHISLPETATPAMRAFWEDREVKQELQDIVAAESDTAAAVCTDGQAAGYPCDSIDLQSFLSLNSIGGTRSNSAANDIWGWTDPDSGKEYAIVGRVFGTSFVDITDSGNPVYLGELPTHGAFGSSWRDIKTYANHAFIVSEALNHGMQVFDLQQLDLVNRAAVPLIFSETAHYSGVAAAHNIAINEDTGYAYIVGASGRNNCGGGLHMVDIAVPTNPFFAGCFDADGYAHDVQCVVYGGPDAAYQGREICFASNEDTVTIVDVEDKSNPFMISRTGYAGAEYTHQGWLSPDHTYFVVDDELDEVNLLHNTRTRFFDVFDLDAPEVVDSFVSSSAAIDHNLYMVGGCAVQANYRSGLRILDAVGLIESTGAVSQTGFFDIYPADDAAAFNGAWSNYPYFPSGNIVVSGIEQGLYVLRPVVPTGAANLEEACALTPPDGNTAPVVSITQPTEPAEFTTDDFIVFAATVTDTEDDPDPTASWSSDIDGSLGHGNEIEANLSEGTHVVAARATDTAYATGTDSIVVVVTVAGGGGDTEMGVSNMEPGLISSNGRRWTGEIVISIASATGAAVADATVNGSWSGGAKGNDSCVTDVAGSCAVSKSAKSGQTMTFTVNDVAHATLIYNPDLNNINTLTISE